MKTMDLIAKKFRKPSLLIGWQFSRQIGGHGKFFLIHGREKPESSWLHRPENSLSRW
jgi:hypothetical protein